MTWKVKLEYLKSKETKKRRQGVGKTQAKAKKISTFTTVITPRTASNLQPTPRELNLQAALSEIRRNS